MKEHTLFWKREVTLEVTDVFVVRADTVEQAIERLKDISSRKELKDFPKNPNDDAAFLYCVPPDEDTYFELLHKAGIRKSEPRATVG